MRSVVYYHWWRNLHPNLHPNPNPNPNPMTTKQNTRCQEEAGNNFWVPWNITDNSAFRPWNGNNGPLHREFGAVHKALPVQVIFYSELMTVVVSHACATCMALRRAATLRGDPWRRLAALGGAWQRVVARFQLSVAFCLPSALRNLGTPTTYTCTFLKLLTPRHPPSATTLLRFSHGFYARSSTARYPAPPTPTHPAALSGLR